MLWPNEIQPQNPKPQIPLVNPFGMNRPVCSCTLFLPLTMIGRSVSLWIHSIIYKNLCHFLYSVGYSCTAQNSGGTVQARAHLTVYTAPVFLETPTSKTVSKGSNVSFRCGVTGNPPPVFWWSKIQVRYGKKD